MKILMLGASGFLGTAVRQFLQYDKDVSIFAPSRSAADVTNSEAIRALAKDFHPEVVLNFAGVSHTQAAPEQQFHVNGFGQKNLLNALIDSDFTGHLVYLSSATVYGDTQLDNLSEDLRPAPNSEYALSKLLGEYFSLISDYRFRVTNVRPFNVIGAGQRSSFLVPKIVSAFAKRQNELFLGNIEVRRDFIDVRDFAQIISLIISSGKCYPVINACNGVDQSIHDIVKNLSVLTGHHPNIRQDQALIRKNDIFFQRGDAALANNIGYQRRFSLKDTLAHMLTLINT